MSTEERLERLERENRNLKKAATVVLIFITSVLLIGQASGNGHFGMLEANEFSLKSAKTGRIGARLGFVAGEPSLLFYDVNGKVLASLTTAGGSARVVLHSADGKAKASASASGVVLFDKDNNVLWKAP